MKLKIWIVTLLPLACANAIFSQKIAGSNPVATDRFTADPAALVHKGAVYLYAGHDEAKDGEMFGLHEWLCYSSKDMKNWTCHGPVLKPTDFKWASGDAWAAQVVEKDGKFYFYATVQHGAPKPCKAIGVAVSDSPTGPFADAKGSALVTDEMTPNPNFWDDIDPTVFIDDDGTPWLCWGNPNCYIAKLKKNMVDLDGPIQQVYLPNYTEGPWIHKRGKTYYLTYASHAHQGFWEKISYATAPSMKGPWTYRGLITGSAKNSYTIHPAIIEFKGQSYFIYHNADLTLPDGRSGALGRRAVCIEYLHYNPDGTIQRIEQTKEGLSLPPAPTKPGGKIAAPQKTDAGVGLVQNAAFLSQNEGFGAKGWVGAPAFASLESPIFAIQSVGFNNRNNGVDKIAQTFVAEKNMKLGRIAVYGGDGEGASDEAPLTLALYDLGKDDGADAESYDTGKNLLGGGKGLKIGYVAQGAGLIHFDFKGANQVNLKAGHKYMFEIQSKKGSTPFYWRQSDRDVYKRGAAYYGGKLGKEKENTFDFALAIYGL